MIIDGEEVARQVREEVKREVQGMPEAPKLAAVLMSPDPASRTYVEMKQKDCREVGIESRVVELPTDAGLDELLDAVEELNRDPTVDGIIVQSPLPSHVPEHRAFSAVAPKKDVDGFHPLNKGLLMNGRPQFVPATPKGVQRLLLETGYPPEGRDVVVLGRSGIVGKPLANLLLQKNDGGNATVTVCHSRTRDVASHTRRADILVAAVGEPEFVSADMVGEGAVVVDVGVNRVDADNDKGYRLVGDVDFDAVSEKAEAVTPVPGGVGPMTRAMLLENTLEAAQQRS